MASDLDSAVSRFSLSLEKEYRGFGYITKTVESLGLNVPTARNAFLAKLSTFGWVSHFGYNDQYQQVIRFCGHDAMNAELLKERLGKVAAIMCPLMTEHADQEVITFSLGCVGIDPEDTPLITAVIEKLAVRGWRAQQNENNLSLMR